ncbi:hypothetical protein ON010_g4279 [Phytophthora cinnamomi]|nr:hypothetical protein ON010_g4279 [Phytophthora cinnamomi]
MTVFEPFMSITNHHGALGAAGLAARGGGTSELTAVSHQFSFASLVLDSRSDIEPVYLTTAQVSLAAATHVLGLVSSMPGSTREVGVVPLTHFVWGPGFCILRKLGAEFGSGEDSARGSLHNASCRPVHKSTLQFKLNRAMPRGYIGNGNDAAALLAEVDAELFEQAAEETANVFADVKELREFVQTVDTMPDALVTVIMCMLAADQLANNRETRLTFVYGFNQSHWKSRSQRGNAVWPPKEMKNMHALKFYHDVLQGSIHAVGMTDPAVIREHGNFEAVKRGQNETASPRSAAREARDRTLRHRSTTCRRRKQQWRSPAAQ